LYYVAVLLLILKLVCISVQRSVFISLGGKSL
jgi:hypothetical protein